MDAGISFPLFLKVTKAREAEVHLINFSLSICILFDPCHGLFWLQYFRYGNQTKVGGLTKKSLYSSNKHKYTQCTIVYSLSCAPYVGVRYCLFVGSPFSTQCIKKLGKKANVQI